MTVYFLNFGSLSDLGLLGSIRLAFFYGVLTVVGSLID
jgi:hypothetical protein